MPDELVNVRYMVDDVEAAVDFYTDPLRLHGALERRARVRRRRARQPAAAAQRPDELGRAADARRPHARSRAAGTASTSSSTTSRPRSSGCAPPALTFRNDIVSGPGRPADPARGPLRQPDRALPARGRLSRGAAARRPALAVILREWGRIGCIGFGGPPAHIALLRELCVTRRGWLDRARVRGRDRGDQPAARPGLDAAGDLLRVAAARRRRERSSAGSASSSPGWS